MREGPWTYNIIIHANAAAAATFTNMPAAETFLFNSHRHITLTNTEGITKVRLKVAKQATAGVAGSKLILRYSPTFSTTVSDYRDIGVTEVSVAINTTNAHLDSGWIEINPDTHDGDVYLAVIGSGGNGTTDPQFGHISIGMA